MKRIYSILLLLVAMVCGGVNAWAEEVCVPKYSTQESPKFYRIKNIQYSRYMVYDGNDTGRSLKLTSDANQATLFYFVSRGKTTTVSRDNVNYTGDAVLIYAQNSGNLALESMTRAWTVNANGRDWFFYETDDAQNKGMHGVNITYNSDPIRVEYNNQDKYPTHGGDFAEYHSLFVFEPVEISLADEVAAALANVPTGKMNQYVQEELDAAVDAAEAEATQENLNALNAAIAAANASIAKYAAVKKVMDWADDKAAAMDDVAQRIRAKGWSVQLPV